MSAPLDPDARVYYVYVLFRLDGDPCYVGKGYGDRWCWHEKVSYHYNKHLSSIVAKARSLGKELPKVKLSQGLTSSEALELEKLFIFAIGRSATGGPLVNQTSGGDGAVGLIHREESKIQTSRALKGRKKTPEHAAKAAAAQRGKKRVSGWWSTPEGRAIHGAKIKAVREARGNYGHTQETREKLRAARMAQKNVSTAGYFKPKVPQAQGEV